MLVEPLEGVIGFANIVLIALQFENVDVDYAFATKHITLNKSEELILVLTGWTEV